MRLSKRLTVISLALSCLVAGQAANANQLAFTANGADITAFEGDASAKSIGGVALPKGTVAISGNTITVNAVPEWLFDRHMVLTGVVINPKLNTVGTSSNITGIAYFYKGEWLDNLGRNQASEIIVLTDGAALSGHILGASNSALDMVLANGQRRSVAFTEIASMTSPRSYNLRIPASSVKIEPSDGSYTAEVADASFGTAMFHGGLAFRGTRKPQVPKSTLPGTEGGISNKYIATMIATDILVNNIAPAIAIPIVFTRSTLHARQLLFTANNGAAGQPPFGPQFYQGAFHFYPTK